MILLDTDHVNVLQSLDRRANTLTSRMDASADQDFAVTAITIEEQMRGWLALIHRFKDVHRQLPAYSRLVGLFDFFARWQIVSFERPAADRFDRLRKQKVRIGTMDLKIASIAMASDALLLTANTRDFEKVPGLRLQNWLVPPSPGGASDGR